MSFTHLATFPAAHGLVPTAQWPASPLPSVQSSLVHTGFFLSVEQPVCTASPAACSDLKHSRAPRDVHFSRASMKVKVAVQLRRGGGGR